MSDSPELAPTSTPQRARASVFLWRGEVGARGPLSAGRRGGANPPRERHGESRGARSDAGLARKAGDAGRWGAKREENNGWFDNLWRKTQKDAEDTIKFIEEEHKKNVQKFEAAVDEIKTTAEEVVDGLQSQLEGRKSLKMLREEKVRGPPRRFFQAPTEPVRPPRRSLQRARLARVRRAALAQSTPPSNLPTLPFTPSSPPRPASSSRHRSSRLRLVASHAPPPASGRRRTPPRLPSRACR